MNYWQRCWNVYVQVIVRILSRRTHNRIRRVQNECQIDAVHLRRSEAYSNVC
jgi:hypothetical protein